MARPARVRMRRRKPCVLARRRLFGWKVRLLTWISVGCGARPTSATSARRPGGAGGGRCDRNRQAHGTAEVLRMEPGGHGHAKEVADTLGQRYGSAGTRVKPEAAARAGRPKPPIVGRRTAIARRHAGTRQNLWTTRLSLSRAPL